MTSGNIYIGNFIKAVFEHKDIKINCESFKIPYIFKYVGNNKYIDISDSEKLDYTDNEIISLFIKDIYNMSYTWEVI